MGFEPKVETRSRRRAVNALAAILCLGTGSASAADLPRYYEPPPPPPAPPEAYLVDPGPASSSGYYGYYGTDILGVPYEGLYSAAPVCLRSIPTRLGYRTVDVCAR